AGEASDESGGLSDGFRVTSRLGNQQDGSMKSDGFIKFCGNPSAYLRRACARHRSDYDCNVGAFHGGKSSSARNFAVNLHSISDTDFFRFVLNVVIIFAIVMKAPLP